MTIYIPPAMKRIARRPDSEIAIAAVALIELQLGQLLGETFKGRQHHLKKLARSVAHRARLALVVGLITEPAFDDIIRLAGIRNRFAHDHIPQSFESRQIADMCMRFNGADRAAELGYTPKDIFVKVALYRSSEIVQATPSYTPPKPRGDEPTN